jgi:drug/metabolite transporter (DMT)-like permease
VPAFSLVHASSLALTAAARHRRAILFMIVAAICWSSGGILVRALSIANAWEIVFWRSLFMAAFVAGVLFVLHGARMPRAVVAVGRPGLLSGLLLAATFFFFIGSLTRTTVANTFVLMSVSPFLAALAGRLVLKEKVPARTWIAIGVAFGGIVVMFADSLDAGRLAGNLMALGVSCGFAGQVTVLRMYHAKIDMLPQVLIAGLCSLAFAFVLSPPFVASGRDIAILALMGCVQLGTGCLLATAASRELSATELGLLALLEPILGPLWVWAFMGERPDDATLTGGVIVLTAVIANEAVAAWRATREGTVAPPPTLTPGP